MAHQASLPLESLDWSPYAGLDPAQPGVVVAVVSAGSVIAWRSFGAVEPGGTPLGTDSTFYVASVAKQFTAACVALLVLDGRVDVVDDVRRLIPEMASCPTPVRVEHLLSHTSGLPDGHEVDRINGFGADRPFTTSQRASLAASCRLVSVPGDVHRYSNYGYVLLARAVEEVAGTCLGRFAADRIFGPLGMVGTGFLDAGPPDPVPGWTTDGRRVDVAFSCVGDGGLVTCIDDLARWDDWLPQSSLAPLMLSDRPILSDGRSAHDAWGISIRTHRGLRIESHGGSLDGYLASCVRFPTEQVSFIALANTDRLGVSADSGAGCAASSTRRCRRHWTGIGRLGPKLTATRSAEERATPRASPGPPADSFPANGPWQGRSTDPLSDVVPLGLVTEVPRPGPTAMGCWRGSSASNL